MSDPSSTDKKVIPIAVAAAEAAPPESPTGPMIRTWAWSRPFAA
jgi:hypothetical protein